MRLAFCVALLLAACEPIEDDGADGECTQEKIDAGECLSTGPSGDSDGFVVVAYDLSACSEMTCNKPNDSDSFKSGSYQSFTCTWHCAEYKGRSQRYVSLTFAPENGCWALSSEYVSSGLCN